MPFDTPTRRPNFAEIYPNEASFYAVRKRDGNVGKKVANHLNDLAIPSASDTFSAFSINAFATAANRRLDSFNMRRFSDYVCGVLNTTIVPASHGRIEDLLLTVPSSPNGRGQVVLDPRHERHYRALIAGLGDNRMYTIVCHPDTEQRIRKWFAGLNDVSVNIVFSPRFHYSIWAQDAYVAVLDGQGAKVLAEGVSFPRSEDMTIADDVAAQAKVAVFQSYLYFQGGNILGGPTKTLIGADYIWRNITRADLETEEKVIDSFKKLFNTDVIVLGGTKSGDYSWYAREVLSGYGFQPIFHLDMYVTPTGVTGQSGKEIVLLGRPRKAHEVTGKWAEISDYNDSRFDRFFEETEQQLAQHFQVEHLPLLLTHGDLNRNSPNKRFYNLSFNNVVIENYKDGDTDRRNVVLTTYSEDSRRFGTDPGIRRDLEQAAETIWSNLGFTVHKMDGMEELAHGLGSVHCITKALKRVPAVASPSPSVV